MPGVVASSDAFKKNSLLVMPVEAAGFLGGNKTPLDGPPCSDTALGPVRITAVNCDGYSTGRLTAKIRMIIIYK